MVKPEARGLRSGARLAVLVNPLARRAGHACWVDEAVRVLLQRYQVDVVSPADPVLIASAARTAATSHEAIVVVGGDGTLNRVVNAIGETVVPIGLLPLGTGNDFARAIGILADATPSAQVGVRVLRPRVADSHRRAGHRPDHLYRDSVGQGVAVYG